MPIGVRPDGIVGFTRVGANDLRRNRNSGSAKLAPFSQGGGATELEVAAFVEVALSIDLLEHLVQMPLLLRPIPHPLGSRATDLGGERRTEAAPPEPDRRVACVDPALVQEVLNVAQGKGKPDVHHHGKVDDIR
jgi:hypothetical protein